MKRKLFTRYEIAAWFIIYALVSSSWSLEDHGEVPSEHIEIGKVLSKLFNPEAAI